MADYYQNVHPYSGHNHRGTLAGDDGVQSFSICKTAMVLLMCSPLLLLFCPLLLGVAFLFVVALAGFAVAAAMALMGVSALGWVSRGTIVRFGGLSKVEDSDQRMKGKELDYWNDRFATTSKA